METKICPKINGLFRSRDERHANHNHRMGCSCHSLSFFKCNQIIEIITLYLCELNYYNYDHEINSLAILLCMPWCRRFADSDLLTSPLNSWPSWGKFGGLSILCSDTHAGWTSEIEGQRETAREGSVTELESDRGWQRDKKRSLKIGGRRCVCRRQFHNDAQSHLVNKL